MDLYIQPADVLEKSAAEVSLPEDANSWPNEIMQELYKQTPYLADFEPHVVMDRVDAERGFGFGHVEVQNKTELQQGASPEARQQVGVNQVRIPIVIKDRKLQPFDLLVTSDSKALPLTEGRLRQALFRPQAFDVTGRTPGDMSMVGQLYPPYRQNYGFGGGGVGMSAGMGKEGSEKCCEKCGEIKCSCGGMKYATREKMWKQADGSNAAEEQFHAKLEKVLGLNPAETAKLKKQKLAFAPAKLPNAVTSATRHTVKGIVPNLAQTMGKVAHARSGSLLQAILPTIRVADYQAFADNFNDKQLQASFMKNAAATQAALQTLLNYEPVSADKLAGAFSVVIKPSVVQLTKQAEGYQVKQANHTAWWPRVSVMDRGEAVAQFGEKVVLATDLTGSVTLTEGEGAKASPEENRAETVAGYGYYNVQTSEGQPLTGFVFPNLYDVDGTPLPVALFTDGTHAALQSEIAGERVNEDVPNLQLGEPSAGSGCFVRMLDGSAEATIPMTIKGGYQDPQGQKWHAETFDGREIFVSVQPNIRMPVMSENTALIPADYKWLSLGQAEDAALVSDPSQWGHKKEAGRKIASVVIRAGGENSFSLDGYALRKLANDQKHFVSLDEALFLLGSCGTDLSYAAEKIAQALTSHAPVEVKVGHEIQPLRAAHQEAKEAAAFKLVQLPTLRCNLVKEAAFLPDPIAVDTVLSLGFINPENMQVFVSYLPQIDQVQSKLCELLLAARLGLANIPVSSLEKTVRSLEEIIDGLKTLAFSRS